MTISINTLKKSRDQLDRLSKEIEKANKPREEFKSDDRFWRAKTDKAGNGYAVIRFLPGAPVDGEEALPWVKYFRHGFLGPTGKWYIENSLTTLGQEDPVSKLNSALWKTEDKDYQKIASAQKRKLTYVSNIYVVSDPASPENEGKVFLFQYGQKIFDKIDEAMFPPFPDKAKFDPFNLWTGANFLLKIRTVAKYLNYDLSNFAPLTPLSDDEAELEVIWNKEHSLKDFVAPDKFKTYEVLKKNLDAAIGCDTDSDEVFGAYSKTPNRAAKAAQAEVSTTKKMVTEAVKSKVVEPDDSDDEATLDYFKALADD